MKVNICGIPHEVKEVKDHFDADTHFGQINYKECEILLNSDTTIENKKVTLCHEILHGMFTHLGYADHSQDEQLIQCLAQAMAQTFDVKWID